MRSLVPPLLASAALAASCGLALAQTIDAQATDVQAMARAAPAGHSVSYSVWAVDGSTVRLRFMLPTSEASGLASPGAPPPDVAAVSAAVGAQVSVTSSGGDCTEIDQGEGVGQVYTMALTPGLDRFEIIFACPTADGLVLHDGVLFDRARDQVNYASVQVGAERPALQMFTADHRSVALPAAPRAPADASPTLLLMRGLRGVFGQADQLCVVAGLALMGRRWLDLGAVAGGLGLGYVGALAVALSGLASLDPIRGAAVMGLLPAVTGASALRLAATPERTSRRWRASAAVALGLIVLAAVAAVVLKDRSLGWTAAGMAVFAVAQAWMSARIWDLAARRSAWRRGCSPCSTAPAWPRISRHCNRAAARRRRC